MQWAQGIALSTLTLVVTVQPSRAESNAVQAEAYVRKACESVWREAGQYQIDRCTARAMASLDDTNRLRDNELKRLLVDSEKELDRCRDELHQVREDAARRETPTARHDPESSGES